MAAKWQEFDSRRQQAAEDVKNNRETSISRYYYRYGQLTQTQSDNASTIRQRHAFFVEEMLTLLSPQKLDAKKVFSNLERQTVFFRDMEVCQWCRMKGNSRRVSWDEAEIHHIVPHAQGGVTEMHNAALVHRECHPKSAIDVREFEEWWSQSGLKPVDASRKKQRRTAKVIQPPDGTKLKFSYGQEVHYGEYVDGKIVLRASGEERQCSSLSEASSVIAGNSRNGWRDWYFCLAGQDQWVLADDWRSEQ